METLIPPLERPTQPLPETPTLTPLPTATATVQPAEAGGRSIFLPPTPRPASASERSIDWPLLIDSITLVLSYIWLACGVVLFLALAAVAVRLLLKRQPHQHR